MKGAIGALRCEVVSSILLRDVCEPYLSEDDGNEQIEGKDTSRIGERRGGPLMEGSELFICRVLDVVSGHEGDLEPEPLLHLKQTYVGVKSIEGDLGIGK